MHVMFSYDVLNFWFEIPSFEKMSCKVVVAKNFRTKLITSVIANALSRNLYMV